MMVKTQHFSQAELSLFQARQQTSFDILKSAAAKLLGGETGKDVAHQLIKDYDASGATSLPIHDGYLVDTYFSFCFGDNQAHQEMMLHLSQYRDSILEAVNRGDGFRAIAKAVNSNMQVTGFEPVHTRHIGEVLGHRAVKLARLPFDAFAISWFNLKDKLATRGLGRQSPLWNALKTSEHPPHDGLCLAEPHAGKERWPQKSEQRYKWIPCLT